MSISCKKRNWVICAYAVPMVCGFGGLASRVDAQNAASGAISQSSTSAASEPQGAESSADEQLRKRVKAALHDDPYSDDNMSTYRSKTVSSCCVGSSSGAGS
jgi:hypothetical protein